MKAPISIVMMLGLLACRDAVFIPAGPPPPPIPVPPAPPPAIPPSSPLYETVDLGVLGVGVYGMRFTEPIALNATGQVVGRSSAEEGIHGFLWDDGTMRKLEVPGYYSVFPGGLNDRSEVAGVAWDNQRTDLAILDASGHRTVADPWSWSVVIAVNSRGDVIGSSYAESRTDGGVWISGNNALTLLGYLDPAGLSTIPTAISERGAVVGNSVAFYVPYGPSSPGGGWNEFGAYRHPFLWVDGTIRDLGVFGWTTDCIYGKNACARGSALDINDRGEVVGYSEDSALVSRPFIWREGRLVDLGVFPNRHAVARTINERGQVAGDGAGGAFLWENGSIDTLPSLGGRITQVTAMNEDGQIVGSALTPGGEERAIVWHAGILIDLGLGLPGAKGSRAIAINDRGDVLGTVFMECPRNDATTLCSDDFPTTQRAVLWRRKELVAGVTRSVAR